MLPAAAPSTPRQRAYRIAKRIAIGIVGGSVFVVGILMIVLPGPAFVVIPAGLGILSLEFAWARSWLEKIKDKAKSVVGAKT
jgi:tellurite resistance protein TerC